MIQNLRHRPIYRKMKVVVGIIRLHKGLEAVKWPKSFWDEISNRVQWVLSTKGPWEDGAILVRHVICSWKGKNYIDNDF